MKVGILTYHFEPNFGAQLQTMSSVGFVKRKGHVPILLHWHPKDMDDLYGHGRIPLEQWNSHIAFANEHFPMTDLCQSEEELLQEIEQQKLDMIITGSDALFKYKPISDRKHFSKRRLRYVDDRIFSFERVEGNPFFCTYYDKLIKKIPVYAFSVSSQNCNYQAMQEKERIAMQHYLRNFKSITVRDRWTKNMVEDIAGYEEIKITPDPVFSFNQNCYVTIPSKTEIMGKYHLPEHYVLISFWTNKVSKEYIQAISASLANFGRTAVAFPMPEGLKDFGLKEMVNIPVNPIDWYSIIIHSEGYIGERMHPIIVCLHNAIPFFVFDEYGVVTKDMFGLKKKYIQESSKTYHIVSEAGFQSNLYAYKGNSPKPTADDIVKSLEEFDADKCMRFAIQQQKKYEMQMDSYLD